MADNSKIEWTHHTFNPWSGCTRISPACLHCYAALAPPARRRHAEWGNQAPRKEAAESYWLQPLAWNALAQRAGERHRVFCASMADFFEDRAELVPLRDRLLCLTQFTPHLDWLLLTKRPEVAAAYLADPALYDRLLEASAWWRKRRPALAAMAISNPKPSSFAAFYPNVWVGTTVENQQTALQRLPALVQIPARVRFLSCEPLLGAVDLTPWLKSLQWVIAGGESGAQARPSHPAWFRALRDQCQEGRVPFFFKQWGEWAPANGAAGMDLIQRDRSLLRTGLFNYDGVWEEVGATPFRQSMDRIGKANAGRLLDGQPWGELPHG